MPTEAVCGEQQPRSFSVSLARPSSCPADCDAPDVEQECGECACCGKCAAFYRIFNLCQCTDDPNCYIYQFPEEAACGAALMSLRLLSEPDDHFGACVTLEFSDPEQSAVCWSRGGFSDCSEIKSLGRRTTGDACCFPREAAVAVKPVPDFVAPQPHYLAGDPADLNNAPFWPTLGIDLMEDSEFAPVRLFNGELQLRVSDVASNGFGVPWGHTRIYSNRLSHSYDFGNGHNWLIHEWPYLVPQQTRAIGKKTTCTVAMVRGTRNTLWFDQYRDGDNLLWRARFGSAHRLIHDKKKNRFRVLAPNGHEWQFYGFSEKGDQKKEPPGALAVHIGPGGQKLEMEYKDGRLAKAKRKEGGKEETFTYQYFKKGPNTGRLQTVLHTRTGLEGGVQRSEYLYYGKDEEHGHCGDLKLAANQVLDRGQWKNLFVNYYRYYKEGTGTYCQGLLEFVVGPEAFRRLVARTVRGNELDAIASKSLTALARQYADSASRETLQSLADLEIVYETSTDASDLQVLERAVKVISMNGGGRRHEFSYKTHPKRYQGAPNVDRSTWRIPVRRTTETRSDGANVTFIGNLLGQLLVHQLEDQSTAGRGAGSSSRWIHSREYEQDRPHLLRVHTPSNINHREGIDAQNWVVVPYGYRGLVRQLKYFVVQPSGQQSAWSFVESVSDLEGSQRERLLLHFSYEKHVARGTAGLAEPSETNSVMVYALKRHIRYGTGNTPGASDAVTVTDYAGWQRAQPVSCTVRMPDIGKLRGPNQIEQRYDRFGHLESLLDLRGTSTDTTYDISTGAPIRSVTRYDAGVPGMPGEKRRPAAVTDFKSDRLGRVTRVEGPQHLALAGPGASHAEQVRRVTWTLYRDLSGNAITVAGYKSGGYAVINPVRINTIDRAGRLVRTVEAKRLGTVGEPAINDQYPQAGWTRWVEHGYDDQGRHGWSRTYHTIPVTGIGAEGANYDQQTFEYDSLYRIHREHTAGGTVVESTYDARGLRTLLRMGSSPANLQDVERREYDNKDERHAPNHAGGNGVLSSVIQYAGQASRKTTFSYNFRDQCNEVVRADGARVVVEPTVQGGLSQAMLRLPEVGTEGNREEVVVAQQIDSRGRVTRSQRWVTNAGASEIKGGYIVDQVVYNSAGDVLEHHAPGSTVVEAYDHDGLGRVVTASMKLRYDGRVLEQSEQQFDDAGNLVKTAIRHRLDTRTVAGPLGALIGIAKNNRIDSRDSFLEFWHDPLGRQLRQVDFGANPGADGARAATIFASNDVVHVTASEFNDRGEPMAVILADGRRHEQILDDAGRVRQTIENAGTVLVRGDDASRSTHFDYTSDGTVRRIRVENGATGGEQVTQFEYQDPLTTTLPSAVTLPANRTYAYAYNAQGEIRTLIDPNGVRHDYRYDALGRLIMDQVSFAAISNSQPSAAAVDRNTLWIGYDYDSRGRLRRVGSGSVRNILDHFIVRHYNHFDQITAETAGEFTTGYEYNVVPEIHAARLDTIRYPNGRVVKLAFDQATRPVTDASNEVVVEAIDRLVAISEPTENAGELRQLARYDYFGLSNLRKASYPQTGTSAANNAIETDLSVNAPLGGLDRFDRLKEIFWTKGPGFENPQIDSAEYARSRTGMVLLRRSFSQDLFSEVYAYDGLDRLTRMVRGSLLTAKIGEQIQAGTEVFAQQWILDSTDNWREFHEDDQGPGTLADGKESWTQVQRRRHNSANRILSITNRQGPAWAAMRYDPSGNTIQAPLPVDPSNRLRCEYDAWNRLVRVRVDTPQGEQTLVDYRYDGLHRCIAKYTYGGVLDGVEQDYRLYIHSPDWQVLEERVLQQTNDPPHAAQTERQYVWGPRGMDDIILRDRDADGDGILEERLYAVQDGNANVTALVDTSGTVVERFHYDPYGRPLSLDPDFVATGESPSDWNVLFAGYRYDPATGLYHVRRRVFHSGLGRWLQTDPQGYEDGPNLYQYGLNSPGTFNDPTGEYIESALDIASLGVGVYSLQDNLRSGNYGWAAVDAVGVLADAAALLLPFVPGGVSLGIRALRGAGVAMDAAQAAKAGMQAARYADATSDFIKLADVGVNSYQAYDAFQRGDYLGAVLGGFHVGPRAVQTALTATRRRGLNLRWYNNRLKGVRWSQFVQQGRGVPTGPGRRLLRSLYDTRVHNHAQAQDLYDQGRLLGVTLDAVSRATKLDFELVLQR